MSTELVSAPLSRDEARALCEEAALVIINKHGGQWMMWLDDKRLRVYGRDGEAIATLHLENLQ